MIDSGNDVHSVVVIVARNKNGNMESLWTRSYNEHRTEESCRRYARILRGVIDTEEEGTIGESRKERD